jgi:hypothetical protein
MEHVEHTPGKPEDWELAHGRKYLDHRECGLVTVIRAYPNSELVVATHMCDRRNSDCKTCNKVKFSFRVGNQTLLSYSGWFTDFLTSEEYSSIQRELIKTKANYYCLKFPGGLNCLFTDRRIPTLPESRIWRFPQLARILKPLLDKTSWEAGRRLEFDWNKKPNPPDYNSPVADPPETAVIESQDTVMEILQRYGWKLEASAYAVYYLTRVKGSPGKTVDELIESELLHVFEAPIG